MERVAKIIIMGIVFISLFLITHEVHADHNQYLFKQGNELYQQEKYEQAIAKYRQIIDNGYESWQVYYNLGNAYFKMGQLGRAILNYERANKLNPKNEDVLFNLNLTNTQVVDNIKTPPLTKLISDIKNLFSLNALLWITIGCYLGATILLIVKILTRKIRVQRLVNIVMSPVLIVLIIFSALFILRVHENNTVRYAILLVDKVDVLGSPAEDGTELFALHEGAKFKIEAYSGEWARIRLTDGNVGWVKKDAFEII